MDLNHRVTAVERKVRGEKQREVKVKLMDRVHLFGVMLNLVQHVAVQQELNGEGEKGRMEVKEREGGK